MRALRRRTQAARFLSSLPARLPMPPISTYKCREGWGIDTPASYRFDQPLRIARRSSVSNGPQIEGVPRHRHVHMRGVRMRPSPANDHAGKRGFLRERLHLASKTSPRRPPPRISSPGCNPTSFMQRHYRPGNGSPPDAHARLRGRVVGFISASSVPRTGSSPRSVPDDFGFRAALGVKSGLPESVRNRSICRGLCFKYLLNNDLRWVAREISIPPAL